MICDFDVEDDEHTIRPSFFTWKVKELKEISFDYLIIVALSHKY